ncbi:MAG: hypothetical protein WCB67_14620 [Solirubrobacteraceae bacterium]
MTATTTLSRVRLIAARVRETLAEMAYAQRRMAEISMGLPLVEPAGRPGIATTVAQLEALYGYQDPRLDGDEFDRHHCR